MRLRPTGLALGFRVQELGQRLERLGWPAETTATRLRAAGLAAAVSAAAAAAPWLKRSGAMTVPASLSTAGRVRLLREHAAALVSDGVHALTARGRHSARLSMQHV